MPSEPQLIVFAGMLGTGKTGLARALARKVGATYLSKDTIKTIALALGEKLRIERTEELAGQLSYELLVYLARDNLTLDRSVVLDSPAAYSVFRDGVRQLAHTLRAYLRLIECICSDEALLRKRVETREIGQPSSRSSDWATYQRDRVKIEEITDRRLVVDTAESLPANLHRILDYLGEASTP